MNLKNAKKDKYGRILKNENFNKKEILAINLAVNNDYATIDELTPIFNKLNEEELFLLIDTIAAAAWDDNFQLIQGDEINMEKKLGSYLYR